MPSAVLLRSLFRFAYREGALAWRNARRERIDRRWKDAPVAVCVVDGPRHVLRCANSAFFALLGDRRAGLGRPIREVFPELESQGVFGALDRARKTGEPVRGRETHVALAGAGGTPRELYLDFAYQPQRSRWGRRPRSILFVANDVTAQVRARKSAEAETKTLQAAVAARDEFLSIASHELKTPLTSLKLQLQITQRRLAMQRSETASAEKINRSIHASGLQVDRLNGLVDDLLNVAQIRSGKMRFVFAPERLGALAQAAADRYRAELARAGVALSLRIPAELEVRCDRARIEQVLINLLTNVVKYAPGAPVAISAEAERGWVRIVCEDGGPGIPERLRSRLFNRFERAEGECGKKGLGLGLYIIRRIVEGHGGTVSAENRRDGGARFTLRMPVNPPEPPGRDGSPAAFSPPG